MKDLFEYKLTSLMFGLLNGWVNTLAGNLKPIVINEANSNIFWMYLFNFDLLIFFGRFEILIYPNSNITTK